MMAEYF